MDDRYLAVRIKGRGVVTFSSCSHAGIVNIMRDVAESGGQKCFAAMGGFHLSGKGMEALIDDSVAWLKKENILGDHGFVLPGHCTGWRAKNKLANAFGDKFQPTSVGATYVFTAAEESPIGVCPAAPK